MAQVTAPGTDGRNRTTRFLSARAVEAVLASHRLIYRCGLPGADAKRLKRMSVVMRERDNHAFGTPEFNALQRDVDAFGRTTVMTDATPFELLQDHAEATATLDLSASVHLPISDVWDALIIGAALQDVELPGVPPTDPLGTWARPGPSRRSVRTALEKKQRVWNRLQKVVDQAAIQIRDRTKLQEYHDTIECMKPLHGLYHTYALLRCDLLEPGRHIASESFAAVLDHAMTMTRTITEHWPCGACEPVAENARNTVMSRVAVNLTAIRPEETTPQAVIQALTDGMGLLEAYIQPILRWPPTPVPSLAFPGSARKTDSDLGWRPVSWFVDVAEAGGHQARLGLKIRRAAADGKFGTGARQPLGVKAKWQLRVQVVADHPEFAQYSRCFIEAARSGFVPPTRRV